MTLQGCWSNQKIQEKIKAWKAGDTSEKKIMKGLNNVEQISIKSERSITNRD